MEHEALVYLNREREQGHKTPGVKEKFSSARVEIPPMMFSLLATGSLKGCKASEGVIYSSFYFKL